MICRLYTQAWLQLVVDTVIFLILLLLELLFISHHFLTLPLLVAFAIILKDVYVVCANYETPPQLRALISLVATINILAAAAVVLFAETPMIAMLQAASSDKVWAFGIMSVLVLVVVVTTHLDMMNSMLHFVHRTIQLSKDYQTLQDTLQESSDDEPPKPQVRGIPYSIPTFDNEPVYVIDKEPVQSSVPTQENVLNVNISYPDLFNRSATHNK